MAKAAPRSKSKPKPKTKPKSKPKTKSSPKTKKPRGGGKPGASAAGAPSGVTITPYQVGFGDCFLLTFHYGEKNRHVLMDFGTKMRSKVGFKVDMVKNAKQIAEDCKVGTDVPGGKLTMVVATHRHYDHISGFETKDDGSGSGDIIRKLKPDLVIQPWTEEPNLPADATAPSDAQKHIRSLVNMQAVADVVTHDAAMILKARKPKKKDDGTDDKTGDDNAALTELDYVGGDNITNRKAVENLMSMAPNKYLHLGSELDVSDILPGVTIHVLGPPTIEQATALKKSLAHYTSSSDEYWKLQANVATGVTPTAGSAGLPGHTRDLPPRARWFASRLRNIREDSMLQIVRSLDKTINNTSLILLIEVGDKKYLFPGDAQLENWSCALADPKVVDLLSGVNVYKVGHHGSLNATPKSLWDKFALRKDKKLETFLSTHADEYGSVPKDSLVAALKSDSQLHSTADYKAGQVSAPVDV